MKPEKSWLYNKKVIITGASSGIGKGLVEILSNSFSCEILGIARNQTKLENVKKSLKNPSLFEFELLDVSDEKSWEQLVEKLSLAGKNYDILINCAGQLPTFNKFTNYSIDECKKIMEINYFSCIYSIKNLFPILSNSKSPAIINIASSAPLCPIAGTSIYSASKASLKALTECLTFELKDKMFVSLICPGFTKTEIFRNQDEVDNSRLMDFICSDCNKICKKIIKGIHKRKIRMILGKDAKLMNFFYSIMPKTAMKMCNWVIKKSKIKLFKNLYNKN